METNNSQSERRGRRRRVKASARARRAAELFADGRTQTEIAKALQTSQAQVSRDIARVVAEDREESRKAIASMRERELTRLERMEHLAIAEYETASDTKDRRAWLDTRLKIAARRSALAGLDAPTKTELSGNVGLAHHTAQLDDMGMVRRAFAEGLKEGVPLDGLLSGLLAFGFDPEDVRAVYDGLAIEAGLSDPMPPKMLDAPAARPELPEIVGNTGEVTLDSTDLDGPGIETDAPETRERYPWDEGWKS